MKLYIDLRDEPAIPAQPGQPPKPPAKTVLFRLSPPPHPTPPEGEKGKAMQEMCIPVADGCTLGELIKAIDYAATRKGVPGAVVALEFVA